MKKIDITAHGEILIDFAPCGTDGNGDAMFARKAGGAPLNVLATAAKYGCDTAFIGKVGKDIHGEFLIETVKKCGIGSYVAIDEEHKTTLAFVQLDERGDRSFSFYRKHGADVYLNENDVPDGVIENSRVFHFGSLSLTAENAKKATDHALEIAKNAGCTVSFDPNYRAKLWENEQTAVNAMREYIVFADIVKLSVEEACMIAGKTDADEALNAVAAMGLKVVLMTDGEGPVRYAVGGKTDTVGVKKVNAVDTTGAGDIFFGTFLTCFLRSGIPVDKLSITDTRPMVEKAVEKASASTLLHGAVASIPPWEINE